MQRHKTFNPDEIPAFAGMTINNQDCENRMFTYSARILKFDEPLGKCSAQRINPVYKQTAGSSFLRRQESFMT
jgi:hypothetical protein